MKVTAFLALTLRMELLENLMAPSDMLAGKCDVIKESWRAHLNGIGQSFCQAKIYLNTKKNRVVTGSGASPSLLYTSCSP
jgi:hypothetical protein